MFRNQRRYLILLSAFLLLTGGVVVLLSQTPGRALIRSRVDEARRITLAGNTRPEVATATDEGEVADDLALDHMMLQLKRSEAQEKEVGQFIDDLQNPASPNFHKWITAAEYGRRFGVAQSDIQEVTAWLESHGFKVNSVYPSNMIIDFSGNAAQIRRGFHTSIHNLDVNGAHHIANVSDPQIPEALSPVVAGVISMHDFAPHKMSRAKRARGNGAQYSYTSGGQTVEAMVPADLATIYNFNPLFAKGITGKGQTVVVVEDSNLYRNSDWNTFRTTFGLDQYTGGALTVVQPPSPAGVPNCGSPGVTPDDGEATLDAEWASAAAPGATIEVASCANTATDGVFLATLNVVASTPPPSIISVSYGVCEAYNGASANTGFSLLYQQAVTEGISVFVASGDELAASCDQGAVSATHGIGVSGWASTPYNVAVGGTDFADVYNGNSSNYWNLTANTATFGSALSYIPEVPWNDSCANSLLAKANGFSTAYGAAGFCGSNAARDGGYLVVGGSTGGPSGCATGAASTPGVVSGNCRGVPKPSWQTGVPGIPNDGARGTPDVSMFASDGAAWGHYSVFCFTDLFNAGSPCKGSPSNWAGVGGTSLSTPVMAGVQALINQSVGSAQGNPNPVYYSLAAKTPSVFHPVTLGDIDVNCTGTQNCFGYVGTVGYGRAGRVFGTTFGGVLSVSSTAFQIAYPAGGSWNFATGLGSVDVNNLVTNWPH